MSMRPTKHKWANSWKRPHDVSMTHALVHTIGLDKNNMLLLDTLRIKRNAIDYTGELVDEGSVIACIEAAVHLQERLQGWLVENRPD